MSRESSFTIGGDIGGTFTDLTLIDQDGSVFNTKAPSTTDDFSRGVHDALEVTATSKGISLRNLLDQTDVLKHGSIVATNALITRNGVKVGLVTTRGFRDTPEIMRAGAGSTACQRTRSGEWPTSRSRTP